MDDSIDVTSLADSLEPLKDHFNGSNSGRQFVALVSPT